MATVVYITAKGRELITNRLGANAGSYAEPKIVGWGTANSAIAATLPGSNQPSDVAPFNEAAEARVTGTASVVTTTTTNDTYQVVGTITSASGQTIGESFLGDSTTKPAATTLSATMTSGATSMTVASASGFPGSGNYDIQVENEVMTVTAGQGTTTWTVTRAANGSTAAAHNNTGVAVTLGNAPGQTIANGDLFLHAAYTGLALNSGDSLAATLQVKFT